jgi:hypothetical protein
VALALYKVARGKWCTAAGKKQCNLAFERSLQQVRVIDILMMEVAHDPHMDWVGCYWVDLVGTHMAGGKSI